MIRFYDLYDHQVARPALRGEAATAPHWRACAGLAARTDLTSPIGLHQRLISVGARAHVRHDLGEAMAAPAIDL